MENVCRSIPSAFRQRQLLARRILGQDDARRVHDLLLHEKRKAVLRFGKQRARFALHARRSRKNNHLSHRKGVQRLGYVGAQIRDARLTLFLRHLQNRALQAKILKALSKHADYIVRHIGPDAAQKPLLETSAVWGGLNSASILEPFVLLYQKTSEPKYLAFSQYIADTGFCKDMNLIDICLHKSAYPYQFKHTKAYEMMSCFEGLLALYQVTGNGD